MAGGVQAGLQVPLDRREDLLTIALAQNAIAALRSSPKLQSILLHERCMFKDESSAESVHIPTQPLLLHLCVGGRHGKGLSGGSTISWPCDKVAHFIHSNSVKLAV